MLPYSMMLNYSAIQAIMQLIIRPIADKIGDKRKQENLFLQLETKQKLDLETIRQNKELDFKNQFKLQQLSHKIRLEEAKKQQEHQKNMWLHGKFDATIWPLKTPPEHHSLENIEINGIIPVNLFFAHADTKSQFGQYMEHNIKTDISKFISNQYCTPNYKPIISRIGDWKNGFFDDAHINALWFELKGQPVIIIRPMQTANGNILDLNLTMWGLGNLPQFTTETLLSINSKEACGRFIKDKTEDLIDFPIDYLSPVQKKNIEIFKEHRQLIKKGKRDIADNVFLSKYNFSEETTGVVIEKFTHHFSNYANCLATLRSDIFHLIEYGNTPQMPLSFVDASFIPPKEIIGQYRSVLTGLTASNYHGDRIINTYLNTAKSLSNFNSLEFKQAAKEIFYESIAIWAHRNLNKEIKIPSSYNECIRLLKEAPTNEQNLELAKSVISTLSNMGEKEIAEEIKSSKKNHYFSHYAPNIDILNTKNIEYCKQKAAEGELDAIFRLGEMYEYSINCKWNNKASHKLYLEASSKGHALAKIKEIISNSKSVNHADIETLWNTIITLSSEGVEQAKIFAAKCYIKGYYVSKNIEKAIDYIDNVSEGNHPISTYLSAEILLDYYPNGAEEAIALLEKSGNSGYVKSQLKLVDIFYDGEIIPSDYKKVFYWCGQAYKQHVPAATFQLGLCYFNGTGTTVSRKKAMILFEEAADLGNHDAIEIINKFKNKTS